MHYSGRKYVTSIFFFIFCASIATFAQPNQNAGTIREKLLMDFGWRFHLGNAASAEKDFDFGPGWSFAKAGSAEGAVKNEFNDSAWQIVTLPHDWAVGLEFVNDPAWPVSSRGFKPLGRNYPETSIGWYRKAFTIPAVDKEKKIELHFDGVFRDCIVWINGYYLGNNLSGYSEFSYDITNFINYDTKNVVVVRVDATQNEGWFYEGAGIYRHVWLIKRAPLHIAEYGTFTYSEVHKDEAEVTIETNVMNQSERSANYSLEFTIKEEDGKPIASQNSGSFRIENFQQQFIKQKIIVKRPLLWSIEQPHLYILNTKIISNNSFVDEDETVFGIRSLRFDKEKGFFLNDKRVEIHGVCCHQDHAGVGSALPDRLQYYRIEKLKEMGVNAYRTSHNPPTKELLDACDRLGMLVLDENRLLNSSPEYMSQLERLVLRDRNHPSVFLWSLGNEEWVIQGSEQAKFITLSMMRKLKELDPSRTCTYAASNGNQFEGVNSVIPIRGVNYMNNTQDLDGYHRDHPDQPILGTEEASTVVTRGVYVTDSTRGYLSDYDIHKPNWGATAEQWWKFYSSREWLEGAFVWTGFDYRGEPTPFGWPCINSHFGVMDMCGFPKNHYYYYQSWWTNKDVLHLSPHWNWKGKEGDTVNVWCQSNCDEIELLLNGKSMGKKKMEKYSHLEWPVPFLSGKLEARGVRNNRPVSSVLETTDEPYSILPVPDRSSINADGEDISIVNITVLDRSGREIATANNEIHFELHGPGNILGVGNGDPSSHEPDKCDENNWKRKLFNGKCQVIVQASRQNGILELVAVSAGLKTATITIQMRKSSARPFVSN
jgi:beta-galactosidase